MVFHYSSKLSHLAYAFRPQPHFSFTRNAYSSSGSAFSSNTFGPQHAVGGSSKTEAGAGTSGSAGGPGGRKKSARNKEQRWPVQVRMVTVVINPDIPRSADEDECCRFEPTSPPPVPRQHPLLSRSPRSRHSERRLSYDRNSAESSPLTSRGSVWRAGAETPTRYDGAFLQLSTIPEEPGVSFAPASSPSRRASFSQAFLLSSTSAFPPLAVSPLPSIPLRTVHTSSQVRPPSSSRRSPFPSTTPPIATIPLVRRNSTATASAVDTEPPPHPAPRPPLTRRRSAGPRLNTLDPRPASPRPASPVLHEPKHRFVSQEAADRHRAIEDALATRDDGVVKRAVREYLSVESTYSTESHTCAILALKASRPPRGSIALIVELYDDLLTRPELEAELRAHQYVIAELGKYDCERSLAIQRLERRQKKRNQARRARGAWGSADHHDKLDTKELEALRQEDYLTPALKIFQSIGRQSGSLGVIAYNPLIRAATLRGRVDLALALLDRFESSRDRPSSPIYVALLEMYGQQKDAASTRAIFQAYLTASATGFIRGKPSVTRPRMMQTDSVKHRYSDQPPMALMDEAMALHLGGQEDLVWRTAIRSMFQAGDAAQAVELVHDMLHAQERAIDDHLPAGFPASLSDATTAVVIAGFAEFAGDVPSACRWFEQRLSSPQEPHEDFFRTVVFGAVRALEVHPEVATINFLNDVLRHYLARRNPRLDPSLLILAFDSNLEQVHYATDAAVKSAALDALTEFVPVCKARLPLSTGLLNRTAVGLSYGGRFEAGLRTLKSLDTVVRKMIRDRADVFREPGAWAFQLKDPTSALLGIRPEWDRNGMVLERRFVYPGADSPQPSIAVAASGVAAYRHAIASAGIGFNHPEQQQIEVAFVGLYLRRRAAAHGDVATLQLEPQHWLAIVESFALVASFQANGMVLPFDFPHFESIVDDFVRADIRLPPGARYNILVAALKRTGMPSRRIQAVLRVLDSHVEELLNSGELVVEDETESEISSRSPVDVAPSSVSSLVLQPPFVTAPTCVATPPSAPPLYFATLPSAPTPPSHLQKIDAQTTKSLEVLCQSQELRTDDAFALVLQRADEGLYPHPAALDRLIELLGRDRKVDKVRHVYMLGYSALPLLDEDPAAQSSAWVSLEDAMVIALANAGLLEEAAVHRLRLVDHGSRPSADAYAALIVNMHETTNDAGVALELFAESQRLGVTPNVYLFNTLLAKLSRARRAREALEYLELMKTLGLRPTSISYGSVMNACCKSGDDATADHLFAEMVSAPGFKPRVPPYNTMMQFYTQTKPSRERALYYYDQLLAANIRPTDHTYKLLLDAYGAVGEPDVASVSDVFNMIVKDSDVKVTGPHWASLIHVWGSVVKDLDRAVAIFDSIATHSATIRDRSYQPDAVVYEALFNAFLTNGRPELCDKYAEQMTARRVKVNAYVQNCLIQSHVLRNDLPSARWIFESMLDPTAGAAAPGNHAERHSQFQHLGLRASAVFREPSSWDIMIRAELAAGEVNGAASLLGRMEERAFPDAGKWSRYDLCKLRTDLQVARAVVRPMRKLLQDAGVETLSL